MLIEIILSYLALSKIHSHLSSNCWFSNCKIDIENQSPKLKNKELILKKPDTPICFNRK